MSVPIRWPWTPKPEPVDHAELEATRQSREKWEEAARGLRAVLVVIDDNVVADRENGER